MTLTCLCHCLLFHFENVLIGYRCILLLPSASIVCNYTIASTCFWLSSHFTIFPVASSSIVFSPYDSWGLWAVWLWSPFKCSSLFVLVFPVHGLLTLAFPSVHSAISWICVPQTYCLIQIGLSLLWIITSVTWIVTVPIKNSLFSRPNEAVLSNKWKMKTNVYKCILNSKGRCYMLLAILFKGPQSHHSAANRP